MSDGAELMLQIVHLDVYEIHIVLKMFELLSLLLQNTVNDILLLQDLLLLKLLEKHLQRHKANNKVINLL